MADTYVVLQDDSPNTGGSLDHEAVTFGAAPLSRLRPRVVLGGDLAAALVFPQLKGVQSTYTLPVERRIDAGKTIRNFFMETPILTTNADVIMSLTQWYNNAVVAATTGPAVVPAGKVLRLESMTITYMGVATAGGAKVRLRVNTGGVAVVGSPIAQSWTIGAAAAVAGVHTHREIEFPNGFEIPAGAGIGVTIVGYSTTAAAAAVGYVQVAINGYEY